MESKRLKELSLRKLELLKDMNCFKDKLNSVREELVKVLLEIDKEKVKYNSNSQLTIGVCTPQEIEEFDDLKWYFSKETNTLLSRKDLIFLLMAEVKEKYGIGEEIEPLY